MAESIQEKLISHFTKAYRDNRFDANKPPVSYLEDFLRGTKDTNPLPVQACFVTISSATGLVDATIRLPHRVSLFGTIALLLLTGPTDTRCLARLCDSRADAFPVLEQCLLQIGAGHGTITGVCAELLGRDMSAIEEMALAHWNKTDQRRFCTLVKRERGPLRDVLAVEYVMES